MEERKFVPDKNRRHVEKRETKVSKGSPEDKLLGIYPPKNCMSAVKCSYHLTGTEMFNERLLITLTMATTLVSSHKLTIQIFNN